MLDILAVLVVIFADVAEVCSEGLDSQRTWDLPTFPLNDQTCHTHTHTHSERGSVETKVSFEGAHFLWSLWSPGQQQDKGERSLLAIIMGLTLFHV